jgi:hypothetical protein
MRSLLDKYKIYYVVLFSAMPTLHKRATKPGYYLRARPSKIGYVTYQIDDPALEFLLELGYRDGADISWSLVRPLRVVGDLYTHKEGTPGAVDSDSVDPVKEGLLRQMTENERKALRQYLQDHPRLSATVLSKLPKSLGLNQSGGLLTPPGQGNPSSGGSQGDSETAVNRLPKDVRKQLVDWVDLTSTSISMLRSQDNPQTVDEFLRRVSTLDGVVESVRAFRDHPVEVCKIDDGRAEYWLMREQRELLDVVEWFFEEFEGYDLQTTPDWWPRSEA